MTFVQAADTRHSLYSTGGVWRLAIEGKELFYVRPQHGWHIHPAAGQHQHAEAERFVGGRRGDWCGRAAADRVGGSGAQSRGCAGWWNRSGSPSGGWAMMIDDDRSNLKRI